MKDFNLNMTKNSNEIRPPYTPEREGGFVERDSHTLYNKISENEYICRSCRRIDQKPKHHLCHEINKAILLASYHESRLKIIKLPSGNYWISYCPDGTPCISMKMSNEEIKDRKERGLSEE